MIQSRKIINQNVDVINCSWSGIPESAPGDCHYFPSIDVRYNVYFYCKRMFYFKGKIKCIDIKNK
jgi:hypothetical protein